MTDNSAAALSHDPTTAQSSEKRPAHWFPPGNNANPYGNTAPLRSLAAEIRRQTGNGMEIASLYLQIMRGEPVKFPQKRITRRKNGKIITSMYVRPTLDQRVSAAAWLADRGWGKAKETIELTGEASPAQRLELLRRLSEEDRQQLRGLLQRALTGPQEPVETGQQDAVIDVPATVDETPSAPQPEPEMLSEPEPPRRGGMALGPRIGRRAQDSEPSR